MKKLKADGGKKITLQDKYKQLQDNTLAALKAKYPGQQFDVKSSSDYRDIPTQLATAKANQFSPTYSLHNLGAADDFNIYQNGKMLDGTSPLYKQVLHSEAKKLGLYPLNIPSDPFHISPVQEGRGHSFTDLLQNYPEVTQSDNYKKGLSSLEELITSGQADKTQIAAYRQLTGSKDNYTPGGYKGALPQMPGKMIGETYVPNNQWTPQYPDIPTPAQNTTPYQYTPQNNITITPPGERKIPTNQQPLDLLQVLPEIYALGSNKTEGVKMQQYAPDLFSPYSVSFQDRINSNNGNLRSLEISLSDNPEALSYLASQTYNANSQAYADQFRTNQGLFSDTENKNVALLNDAQGRNLQLQDQQYVRQQQAQSNTKAVTHGALDSITSKYLQQQAQNKTLSLYENLYNYRFDNNGTTVNYTPPVDFSSFGNSSDNTDPYASKKVTTDKNGDLKQVETTTPAPITFPSLMDKNSPYNRFRGNYRRLKNGGIVKLTK